MKISSIPFTKWAFHGQDCYFQSTCQHMRGLTGRSCWNSNSTTISWHELDARLWTQLFHTLCHLILTALVPLYEIGTVIAHIFQTRDWGADPWKPNVTQLVSGGIEIWILSVLCQGFCLNEWISGWWGHGSWRESFIFRTSPVCPGFSLPSVCKEGLSQGPFFAGSNPVAVPSFHGKWHFWISYSKNKLQFVRSPWGPAQAIQNSHLPVSLAGN